MRRKRKVVADVPPPRRRLPVKLWLLLVVALVAALTPIVVSWTGRGGPGQPATFLDAVAEGFGKDPRVSVQRIDHEAGRIVLEVKPTHQTLIFQLTHTDAATQPGGEVWTYEWRDPVGKVIALGRTRGTKTENMHVSVPGLP
jgi:hypothetical protein